MHVGIVRRVYEELIYRIRPGSFGAVAIISGFWASQALAWYYIGGSLNGDNSKLAGDLAAGLFTVFFLLHINGPWSRLAAFFGLCSLGVSTAFLSYLSSAGHGAGIFKTDDVVMLAAGLFMAGVALDAEKYRQWLHRKPSRPLKLRDAKSQNK